MTSAGQKYFLIGPDNTYSRETVEAIADGLSRGKIAVLPTSTIYGLSCVYGNKSAVERIYEIKQRPKVLPLIILVSGIDDIDKLAGKKNRFADVLIKKYWISSNPRPVTLVFNKNKSLPDFVASGSNGIALRLDSLNLIRDIIRICGPIVSTSATVSGTVNAPASIEQVPEEIKGRADIIVEMKAGMSGVVSTIVDVTREMPEITRDGNVSRLEIMDLLNKHG